MIRRYLMYGGTSTLPTSAYARSSVGRTLPDAALGSPEPPAGNGP